MAIPKKIIQKKCLVSTTDDLFHHSYISSHIWYHIPIPIALFLSVVMIVINDEKKKNDVWVCFDFEGSSALCKIISDFTRL